MANPTAMILSGRLMFDYLGWDEASDLIRDAVEETISEGLVTYDLERQLEDAEKLATSEYTDEIVAKIEELA
jgi:isocitrate dehydrogenase